MSITSRSSAILLASAVAGLAAVGSAASDDWEAPVASATAAGDDVDCRDPEAKDDGAPRDEQMVIEELITEMQCFTTSARWPRSCGTTED